MMMQNDVFDITMNEHPLNAKGVYQFESLAFHGKGRRMMYPYANATNQVFMCRIRGDIKMAATGLRNYPLKTDS